MSSRMEGIFATNSRFTGVARYDDRWGSSEIAKMNFPEYFRWLGRALTVLRESALIGVGTAVGLLVFAILAENVIAGDLIGWMAANKDLAPWFSGFFTALGVAVALLNADGARRDAERREAKQLAKENRDRRRKERAYLTAVRSAASLVAANARIVRDRLEDEPRLVRTASSRVIRRAIIAADDAMAHFSVEKFERKGLLRRWTLLQIAHHAFAKVLEEIDADPTAVAAKVGQLRALTERIETLFSDIKRLTGASPHGPSTR